jgi:hypothetical protein
VMTKLRNMLRIPLLGLTLALGAAGCSSAPKTLGLPMVGVNYTDFDYSVAVYDLANERNRVSSGELTPFSAGGQMCCFDLPRVWRPGLKVNVRSYKGVSENGVWVRDDTTDHEVEVPRYDTADLGTLWVLQFADGRVELLNSSVAPGHPKWAGSVKGWPVPSVAYRTKVWKIYYDRALEGIQLYKGFLDEADRVPEERSRKAWATAMQYRNESLKGFSGPADPAFLASLKKEYSEGLARSQAEVEKLERERPQ